MEPASSRKAQTRNATSSASSSTAAASGGRATTTDRVEQQLVADITTGRLPPGSKFGFEMLKNRYGVGVSALREALQRLVSENMVTLEGHVGFKVAPFRLDDLKDINALRRELTGQALRSAIEQGTPEWEGQVLAAAHALSRLPLSAEPTPSEMDAWEAAHRHFHETLLSACTSRWLLHFCRTLDTQYLRYRRIVLARYSSTPTVRQQINTEHQAIVEAALAHDADLAVALLHEHYDRSARDVVEEYEKQSNAPGGITVTTSPG